MTEIREGMVLGDTYQIIEEIGAGGGGVVFRAIHMRLKTDVVIKKIKDEVRNKVILRKEADILKNLKHPYLPRVYDFIETENGVYTVMDFIAGTDLDTAVRTRGSFSQKQVRKWAEQLGDVLAYLHSQKPPIIHSDIKPANIMLTEGDNICLIDFNISLVVEDGIESAVGISIGYSPPEQYKDPLLYARITRNNIPKKLSVEMSQSFLEKKDDNLVEKSSRDTLMDYDLYHGIEETEILPPKTYQETEVVAAENVTDETEMLFPPKQETLLLKERKKATDNTGEIKKGYASNEEAGCRGSVLPISEHLPSYTQFMGRGIDERSDIYSLGMTLYYLLTGLDIPMEFDKRIPIQDTGITISEGFAIILEKMMEVSPDKRYRDGKEFFKAIKNCQKLDRRYLAMRSKVNLLRFGALGSFLIGVLLITGGIYTMHMERNNAYYELVHQATEAMENYSYEEAEMFLEQAKGMLDNRVSAYEKEVHLLYLMGDYEKCIEVGENYINTRPFLLQSSTDEEEFGDILYLVGSAYFETGDYINAANFFDHAISYHSHNGLYYRDYAIALAKIGQIDLAEEFLEEGIRKGIDQESVSMIRGEIAHMKGENDEALEEISRVLEVTDDPVMKKRAILLAVDVYRSQGDKALDEEILLLEKYRSEFETVGNLVMTEYLADAYVRKAGSGEQKESEYYEKALLLFQGISEKGVMSYQLKENMAILYQNIDDFDRAETILTEMKEEYPQKYEVFKRLAYLEADKQQTLQNSERDYLKMKDYYEKALEKYPETGGDVEMDMLGNMMEELNAGGWF